MRILLTLLAVNAFSAENEKLGCTSLVNNFCQELYTPARQGNWNLKLEKSTLKIRRGLTPNDFGNAYHRGSQLILQNQHLFPADFSAELRKVGYFEKLKTYLSTKPVDKTSLSERSRYTYASGALASLWRSSLRATVLRRMHKRYPSHHRVRNRDLPPAWRLEEDQALKDLKIEVNRARWVNSPEWEKAVKEFEEAREAILSLVANLENASAEKKAMLRERLLAVTLQPPGSTENHLDDDCAEDLDNASYNLAYNTVQVCAGLITSTSTIFTVAHELAHALDPGSIAYAQRAGSNLGRAIVDLKETQCSGKVFPCESWTKLKQDFQKLTDEIPFFSPEPAAFYQCFLRRNLDKPSAEYISTQARRWANDDLEWFSRRSAFLKLVKKDAKTMDGKTHSNPAYLNPCNLDVWNRYHYNLPVNSTTPLLLYFTAEYSCTEKMPPVTRMRNAIEVAKNLQQIFNRRSMEASGPYFQDKTFVSEGFAENIDERVADTIGSEAVAKILAKRPTLQERRLQFYSVLADRCEEPSWKSRFPEEAEAENEHSWHSHTLGQKRIFECMPASVRKEVACEKDFELRECAFR
jgi:hypothetical protein